MSDICEVLGLRGWIRVERIKKFHDGWIHYRIEGINGTAPPYEWRDIRTPGEMTYLWYATCDAMTAQRVEDAKIACSFGYDLP